MYLKYYRAIITERVIYQFELTRPLVGKLTKK